MRKNVLFFCMTLVCVVSMSSVIPYYPIFSSYTNSYACPIGSNAQFDARVDGIPIPALEARFENRYLDWAKMTTNFGKPILKYHSIYYNGRYSLKIFCVDETDQGRYSFIAYNDQGTSEIYINLIVW